MVKYGRIAIVALGLTLSTIVFLPNGSYIWGRSVVRINALSSPFSDYGIVEVSVVVVMVMLTLLTWARQSRGGRISAWGSVYVCAGLLGILLPDMWQRNIISLPQGGGYKDIAVKLQYGFWMNLTLVATALVISSIVLWNEPRPDHPIRHRYIGVPNHISK